MLRFVLNILTHLLTLNNSLKLHKNILIDMTIVRIFYENNKSRLTEKVIIIVNNCFDAILLLYLKFETLLVLKRGKKITIPII